MQHWLSEGVLKASTCISGDGQVEVVRAGAEGGKPDFHIVGGLYLVGIYIECVARSTTCYQVGPYHWCIRIPRYVEQVFLVYVNCLPYHKQSSTQCSKERNECREQRNNDTVHTLLHCKNCRALMIRKELITQKLMCWKISPVLMRTSTLQQ